MLVDSSVWIDYFNGVDNACSEALDRSLGKDHIVIGDLIVTEVLQGFRSDRDYRSARRLLSSLEVSTLLGPSMAIKVADNFRELRKKGITVRKTADLIIASYCIENRMILLQNERDFLPMVEHLGLQCVSINH